LHPFLREKPTTIVNKRIVSHLSYKTVSVNKANADKKWVIVDADGQTVGRMASRVAMVLRGKHKPTYTPHSDCGDNVIVINADKVILSGMKWTSKEYVRHTGYPGGQRTATAQQLFERFPERIVENAVRGMLPKNKLGRALFRNMKVYVGSEHDHEAQKPEVLNFNDFKL
jgi:large subunit ribosomal protein L13